MLDGTSSDSVPGISGHEGECGISSSVSFTSKESGFDGSQLSLLSSLDALMTPVSFSSVVSMLPFSEMAVWFSTPQIFLSRYEETYFSRIHKEE